MSHDLQPLPTSAPGTPRLQLGVRGKLLTGFGFAAFLVVVVGLDGLSRVTEEHRHFARQLEDSGSAERQLHDPTERRA